MRIRTRGARIARWMFSMRVRCVLTENHGIVDHRDRMPTAWTPRCIARLARRRELQERRWSILSLHGGEWCEQSEPEDKESC